MIRLFNASAEDFLKKDEGNWDCIFMDPPDNDDLKYNGYYDVRSDYYTWLESLILESLLRCKVLWVSYYWKHDLNLKYIVGRILRDYHPSWSVKNFIWSFKFGQHRNTDCGSGFRFLLRLSRYDHSWNTDAIRVASVRQKMNDKRACLNGAVPLDVWEFPRVTGNSSERRAWHPTQHPEALMRRLYLLSNCKTALDLFAGSGTSIRVCKSLKIDLDTVEISPFYCKMLRAEHNL